jgi:hypothetical protein
MKCLRPVSLGLAICIPLIFSESASAQTKASHDSSVPAHGRRYSAELTASDGVAGNALGIAVAVSGNTVVVGENCGEIGGNPYCNFQNEGVVYVYQKPQNGWGDMVQTAELTPSDGYVGDYFGESVAIDGNTIVVASQDKAYVYVSSNGNWQNMTETAQLTSGVAGYFGGAVAIDKNTIVVGGAGTGGDAGQDAAYVFVEPATGWVTTSAFAAQLTTSHTDYQGFFGSSLGISGDTIIVGAAFQRDGQTGPGETYVFAEPTTGWTTTTQTATLTRSPQGPYDEFGLSVAISNDTVVVGAQQATSENNLQGVADVFVEPPTGWVDSTQTVELEAPVYFTLLQHFGGSVAVCNSSIVVGDFSPSNVIFLYDKPTSGWQSASEPQAGLRTRTEYSFFGFSVAISDDIVVAGAPLQTVDGSTYQGAAFVFSQ